MERFGDPASPVRLILLSGADGPSSASRTSAAFFAAHGYFVVLPHYLDAGQGQLPTETNLRLWIGAVRSSMESTHQAATVSTVLVGYSLGASVALSLGSEGQGPAAIAEFSGSLPDRYFRDLKGMPPLLIFHGERDVVVPVSNARALSQLCEGAQLECEVNIYPDQGHHFSASVLAVANQRVLDFFSAHTKPAPTNR